MKLWRSIVALLPVVLLGVAGWVLYRELRAVHLADLSRSLQLLDVRRVAFAVILTAFNYLWLTQYDALSLLYIRRRLPIGRLILIAFVSTAFGHNIGASLVSGGSARYRLYSRAGLAGAHIAKLIAFGSVTFGIGTCLIAGTVFLLSPVSAFALLPVPPRFLRMIGGVLLLMVVAYLVFSVAVKRPLRLRNVELEAPSFRLALTQVCIPSIEWLVLTAVLHLVLPGGAIPYSVLLVVLLFAQTAGSLSQVPGGLGVFESIVVSALAPRIPVQTVFGCLLLYRIIYYLTPLAVAIVAFVAEELALRAAQRGR